MIEIASRNSPLADGVTCLNEAARTFVGGYVEMYTVAIGNNITDMELTPDNELGMIDQGGEGLIMFDVIDGFNIIGHPVN